MSDDSSKMDPTKNKFLVIFLFYRPPTLQKRFETRMSTNKSNVRGLTGINRYHMIAGIALIAVCAAIKVLRRSRGPRIFG